MSRAADIEKALRDLRPTYVALRKAWDDLKKDEVRQTMNVRVKVEAQASAAREIIGDRAREIGIESVEGMITILDVAHTKAKRFGRKPTYRQIVVGVRDRLDGYQKALPIADQEAVDAAAHAETVRKRRDAAAAASFAVTGYSS